MIPPPHPSPPQSVSLSPPAQHKALGAGWWSHSRPPPCVPPSLLAFLHPSPFTLQPPREVGGMGEAKGGCWVTPKPSLPPGGGTGLGPQKQLPKNLTHTSPPLSTFRERRLMGILGGLQPLAPPACTPQYVQGGWGAWGCSGGSTPLPSSANTPQPSTASNGCETGSSHPSPTILGRLVLGAGGAQQNPQPCSRILKAPPPKSPAALCAPPWRGKKVQDAPPQHSHQLLKPPQDRQ